MKELKKIECRGGENHIFLIQAHKESLLLERILNRITAPNHYFAINIDCKSDEFNELMQVIQKFKNIIYITNHNIIHGGFSQIACTVEQMRFALNYTVQFDYFHTISGQDYPCVSVEKFDSFFQNNTKSYMLIDTEEEISKWRYSKYKERLEQYWLIDVFNGKSKLNKWFFWKINHIVKHIPRKYAFLDSVCGGWNWFSLHRKVVEYVIHYFGKYPEYYNRFKYTYCCDELIFSTILYPVAKEYEINTRNSLRFVEWHPKRLCKFPPLILNENEYEEIVQSGAFFCRKCEWNESFNLMKLLDEHSKL